MGDIIDVVKRLLFLFIIATILFFVKMIARTVLDVEISGATKFNRALFWVILHVSGALIFGSLLYAFGWIEFKWPN
jgi:hypothetical protein